MDGQRLKELMLAVARLRRGDQRAPHKDLVMLYTLGRYRDRSAPRLQPYRDAEAALKGLLQEYSPWASAPKPEYPFWRLRKAKGDIWEVTNQEQIADTGSDNASIVDLRDHAAGGFSRQAYDLIMQSPELLEELARPLLNRNFPPTLHGEIKRMVGLDFLPDVWDRSQRRRRNPEFRDRVLHAYGCSCAVCGFDIKLDGQELALEAAHIKWHCYRGPDEGNNGLALCTVHHHLLDKGAYTIRENMTIEVSPRPTGGQSLQKWLKDFDGSRIAKPTDASCEPNPAYLNWHRREVFKRGD